MCEHDRVRLNKHPQNSDNVLESCANCKKIQAVNIKTEENVIVHKGSKMFRMLDGPAGSLFVVEKGLELSKLSWGQGQSDEVQMVYKRNVSVGRLKKQYLRFCYVECHDILLFTLKNPVSDEDYELIAMKLDSGTVMWRFLGPVDDHTFKPRCITCDDEGNAYVSDRATNRILQIDSLTGEILRILLLDEEEDSERIQSMRWSNTEPNLTFRTGNGMNTYFVPK